VDAAVRSVCDTYAAYLALGHAVEDGPGARLVRAPEAPLIWDANHVQGVTAAEPEAVEAALDWADRSQQGLEHRHVLADPSTPPAFTARLALDGYRAKPTLQMLLRGPLLGPPPPPVELRPVESEADWASLRTLLREDHQEICAREKRPPYEEAVTDQMIAVKRAKAPELRFWLARDRGADAAFFSSWPGVAGVGMVEDLFTRPRARRRGLARALIHRAVADARERGAGAVLIGADPTDTPKQAYAALGFRPVCLTWSWLRDKG